MTGIEVRNFDKPDETRMFEGNGYTDVVTLAGRTVCRTVFEPGFRWSANLKPIVGTDQCEARHLAYCLSGRIRIHMADGSEQDVAPGDIVAVPPGHDAEVIGDEACVTVDFGDMANYARHA